MKEQKAREIAEDVSPRLAQDRALGRPVGEKIYRVEPGWEATLLEEEGKMTSVRDTMAYEASLSDPGVKAILIPQDANIVSRHVFDIADRSPLTKKVFWVSSENPWDHDQNA